MECIYGQLNIEHPSGRVLMVSYNSKFGQKVAVGNSFFVRKKDLFLGGEFSANESI